MHTIIIINFFITIETTDKWQQTVFTGDRITPRFFSAIGPSDKSMKFFCLADMEMNRATRWLAANNIMIYTGLILENHTIKKCWEIHPDSSVFVPANNLILSDDKKYFYALCYPHEVAKTALTLYKFSIKDGSYEIVSAPIPVTSERIESDVNLFYNNSTKEFFCTEQEFTDRNNSTIKIFSLEAPPLSRALYNQSLVPAKKSKSNLFMWLLAVLTTATVIFILYKERHYKKQTAFKHPPEPMQLQPRLVENDNNEIEINTE